MRTSEHINELAGALAKTQGQIEGATKSSINPFFKSKYAGLSSVWDACRKALTNNGLAVVQSPSAQGIQVTVTTRLLHVSGQWIEGDVRTEAKDASPQSVGSAITYLRRYALQSFIGVAPEDDDAEAAQGRGKTMNGEPAKPPAGYQDWLDDFTAVADEGFNPLQTAWKASKPEYRDYLSSTNKAGLERLKADAKAVDAARRSAA